MKKLIIIPAYNEEDNLKKLINNIKKYAPSFDYIIVNDCSTDNTAEVCRVNNYNYISLPINLGIGGCVQTGYKYAYQNGYDYAVQVDGDGQHNPEYLKSLMDKILEENIDFVIGSRFIEKSGFQSTLSRRIGITFLSKLIEFTTGTEVKDVTSGFRLGNREIIKCFAKSYPRDYPEPESIVTLKRKGFNIVEVPVEMLERQSGTSSIKSMKTVYYMVKVSLAILIDWIKTT